MSPALISVIGITISLTLTFSIPFAIRSRGIYLNKTKIILISIADFVFSYIATSFIILALISIFGYSGSIPLSRIVIGLGGLISFFLVKRIIETSPAISYTRSELPENLYSY